MQSIKTIYKIGLDLAVHTFGPMMASKYINEQYHDATHFKNHFILVP